MRSGLPLEVLGLISPILAWVEGGSPYGLPMYWGSKSRYFSKKPEHWLRKELPHFSVDNFNEILEVAGAGQAQSPILHFFRKQTPGKLLRISPPKDYKLVEVMKKLTSRYFVWSRNELLIREGYMTELHELAIRISPRHMICFARSLAACQGMIHEDSLYAKTDDYTAFHTAFQGFRNVVMRGLTETHLHLSAIITADETWADALMDKSKNLSLLPADTERLIFLSRTIAETMALALFAFQTPKKINTHFMKMLALFDQTYFESNRRRYNVLKRQLSKLHFANLNHVLGPVLRDPDLVQNPIIFEGIRYLAPKLLRMENPNRNYAEKMELKLQLLRRLHAETYRFLIMNAPSSGQGKPKRGYDVVQEILFRYLIMQTYHWQNTTLGDPTTGLRHFRSYLGNKLRKIEDPLAAKVLSAKRIGDEEAIHQVEGRLSPPRLDGRDYPGWILAFLEQRKRKALQKFGIVVHFKKAVDTKPHFKSKWSHLRFGQISASIQADAFHLYRYMTTPDLLSLFIVGIDAANLELTTPPHVFAPSFHFLRSEPLEPRLWRTSRQRYNRMHEFKELFTKHRLGMTYHVGEDFRHILSGLRAIHEVIEFLAPMPGDRLGHAIALSIDPQHWMEQVGWQVVLPKGEWLDNLVWLYHVLGPSDPVCRELKLVDQIRRLGRHIYQLHTNTKQYQITISPELLQDTWQLRQLDPFCIKAEKLGFSRLEKFTHQRNYYRDDFQRWSMIQEKKGRELDEKLGSSEAYTLLGRYWFSRKTCVQGEELISVSFFEQRVAWIKACSEAQARMQNMVGQFQLIIETNPSSNRVIGQLSQFRDHSIFKLTLDDNFKLRNKVRASVNTDNPGMLATSLTHEYYLLAEILLQKGATEQQAVEWLEWLRSNGEAYSFLKNLPDLENDAFQRLVQQLKHAHPLLNTYVKGERRKPLAILLSQKPKT